MGYKISEKSRAAIEMLRDRCAEEGNEMELRACRIALGEEKADRETWPETRQAALTFCLEIVSGRLKSRSLWAGA